MLLAAIVVLWTLLEAWCAPGLATARAGRIVGAARGRDGGPA
jgi:hypothetical protein